LPGARLRSIGRSWFLSQGPFLAEFGLGPHFFFLAPTRSDPSNVVFLFSRSLAFFCLKRGSSPSFFSFGFIAGERISFTPRLFLFTAFRKKLRFSLPTFFSYFLLVVLRCRGERVSAACGDVPSLGLKILEALQSAVSSTMVVSGPQQKVPTPVPLPSQLEEET